MTRAETLNRSCACASPAAEGLASFHSQTPLFIDTQQSREMARVVHAAHSVMTLPAWREAALAAAPPLARHDPRTPGVFAGFDFHLTPAGPRLIEINTNAGGAMINAVAEWRYPDCCAAPEFHAVLPPDRPRLEAAFIAMFRDEWRRARGDAELRSVVIVDDEPDKQFLFPEFQLFAQLFENHGIRAAVADPRELESDTGVLRHRTASVDLVYNRLTDFYFEDAGHAVLRAAYEQDAAVITPHPRAHALTADKRLLTWLSDETFLRGLGAVEADIAVLLKGVPRTRLVEGSAEDWWKDRKRWFFKPASGFGSRGAYRGDKLTRRVFEDILKGGYVAQEIAAPSERLARSDSQPGFKVDIRHYAYAGEVLLRAARLYQGQTTNFRTAGGGFAPVIEMPDAGAAGVGLICERDSNPA